jgi:hypothetical protein
MDQLAQLAATDRNPIQERDYQNLLTQNKVPFTVENGKANVTGFGVGGNNFGDQARSFFTPQNIQGQAQATQAQTAYQAGIGSAVGQLQTAGTNLDTQYKSLLSSILGQGTVAMNTATTGENNLLASRGITNNSPLYSQQMTQAQLPVTAQNQAAVSGLGFTEGQLQTGLAAQIAGLQAGGAGTMANLPLQYGSLALGQAANLANIGLTRAQTNVTKYVPIPGVGLWDTSAGQFVGGITNNNLTTGGYSILNVR